MFSRAPESVLALRGADSAIAAEGTKLPERPAAARTAIDGFQQGDQIAFHLQPAVAIGVAELEVRIQQHLPKGRADRGSECGPSARAADSAISSPFHSTSASGGLPIARKMRWASRRSMPNTRGLLARAAAIEAGRSVTGRGPAS